MAKHSTKYNRNGLLEKLKELIKPKSLLEVEVAKRRDYYVNNFTKTFKEYMDVNREDILKEPYVLQGILDFHIPNIPAYQVDIEKKKCYQKDEFMPGDFRTQYNLIDYEFNMLKDFHIELGVFIQNPENLFKYKEIYEKILKYKNEFPGDYCSDTYIIGHYSLLDIMKEHVDLGLKNKVYISYVEKEYLTSQIENETFHLNKTQIKRL